MKAPAGTISFQDAAKALFSKGVLTGPCLLVRQLKRRKILMADNTPYQEYLTRGWFCVMCGTWRHPVTEEKEQYVRTFITEKGFREIQRILTEKPKPKQDEFYEKLNFPECILGF